MGTIPHEMQSEWTEHSVILAVLYAAKPFDLCRSITQLGAYRVKFEKISSKIEKIRIVFFEITR